MVKCNFAGVDVGDSYPVRIMGVLNLSPESFYKGSVVNTVDIALEKAKQMVTEGADFLDLGAMSTAPGVDKISEEEEHSRLIPSLKAILDAVDVPISVDTFRANIAESALSVGAKIINDVSGFKKDQRMVKVLTDHDASSIIMATSKQIGDPLTIPKTIESLRSSLTLAKNADYDISKTVLDPAIGRWVPEKTFQYNIDIIKNLAELSKLKRPILVGISRKSFIHEILNRPNPNDRLSGSLAATAIAVFNGAHIIRTHDVAASVDAVRITELLRRSSRD